MRLKKERLFGNLQHLKTSHSPALLIGMLCRRWYHPYIDRHSAEALLMANGCEGAYLLRQSGNHPGHLTLTVRYVLALSHFSSVPTGIRTYLEIIDI